MFITKISAVFSYIVAAPLKKKTTNNIEYMYVSKFLDISAIELLIKDGPLVLKLLKIPVFNCKTINRNIKKEENG